jgi:hypothetical protein
MLSRLQFGKKGGVVPNLVVAQRVIDKMVAAAQHYLEDETGEAMVGLIVENPHSGIPTLYVLDTISPDETAIRHFHTFQQGDERQDEILWWMRENWRVYRSQLADQIAPDNPLRNKITDSPLQYLGDWHKQPGHMIEPSGGDLMTALDWIYDEGSTLGFMVAPILTMDYPNVDAASGVTTNYLTIPNGDGTNMRVDFWYIDQKTRGFVPITPTVYQDKDLPALPPYPWHLVHQARYDEENDLLTAEGMFISVTLWDADGELPLEICFLLARRDSEKLLIITTEHDYPKQPPTARLAPIIPMDANVEMYAVFEEAFAKSELLVDDTPKSWGDADRLVNFVRQLEAKYDLHTETPVIEQSVGTNLQSGTHDPLETSSSTEMTAENAAPAAQLSVSEAPLVETTHALSEKTTTKTNTIRLQEDDDSESDDNHDQSESNNDDEEGDE